uniref:Uncharacterized protein n=1 Tax=viral metagenome TaxID=1070528 RepID=A0A6C0EK48_9ZZZZ
MKYKKELGVFGLFIISEEIDKRKDKVKFLKRYKNKLNVRKSNTEQSNVEKKKLSEEKYLKLQHYNKRAAQIQLFNGIVQLLGTLNKDKNKDVKKQSYKINIYKYKYPRTSTPGKSIWIKNYSLGYSIALFSFLTSLSHYSFISFRKDKYREYIDNQINIQRWLEYSITSSIMMFSLFGLSMIDYMEEIVPLTILIAVTNIFGLGIESIKDRDKENLRTILFRAGIFTNGWPWIFLSYKYKEGIKNITKEQFIDRLAENAPDEYSASKEDGVKYTNAEKVWEIFDTKIKSAITILIYALRGLYLLFPANMYFNYLKPLRTLPPESEGMLDPDDFYKLEKNYIFLSMAAKSTLSWIIWSATLRPNTD